MEQNEREDVRQDVRPPWYRGLEEYPRRSDVKVHGPQPVGYIVTSG